MYPRNRVIREKPNLPPQPKISGDAYDWYSMTNIDETLGVQLVHKALHLVVDCPGPAGKCLNMFGANEPLPVNL